MRLLKSVAGTVALMLGLMAVVAIPATAQDSTPAAEQPVVVGDTEITWEGDWEYDETSAMSQQATFTMIDMEAQILRLLSYGVFADDSVEDADQAVDVFAAAFFEGAGLEATEPNATGELEDGTIWRVYSFSLSGTQVSFLITASVTEAGEFVVTSLTSNTEVLGDSITAVQEDFTLDEDGEIFEGIDADEVSSALGDLATPSASPEASPVSTPAA